MGKYNLTEHVAFSPSLALYAILVFHKYSSIDHSHTDVWEYEIMESTVLGFGAYLHLYYTLLRVFVLLFHQTNTKSL